MSQRKKKKLIKHIVIFPFNQKSLYLLFPFSSQTFFFIVILKLLKSLAILGFSRCTYPADIGFLVDSSGSLNKEGFNKQKDFVEDLAERLDISPVDSLIGVVTYSDKASVEIKFSDYEYQEDLIKAIEALQYKGRTTRIDKAINMATRELMSSRGGRREKIPAIMVILTDGRQTLDSDTKPLKEATANMLKLGIKTLVVGIGELADKKVLRKMTKRDEDVFMAPSLSVLPNVVQPVVASICQAAGSYVKTRVLVLEQ